MKKCPFCAEEIQDEAIKCRFCSSEIVSTILTDENKSKLPPAHAKNWAVVAHLGGLLLVACLSLIIPLVIYLLKAKEDAFIEKQAKEALNFQISLVIYAIIAIFACFTIIGIPFVILAFIFFVVVNFICSIAGAVAVSQGKEYKYPFSLRLIS